jgi:glycosyltransferase involved in cell wall biosynthesis
VLTVAYLANQFPVAVEPYVLAEIEELRRRGVRVIPGSVRRPDAALCTSVNSASVPEILCLQPVRALVLLRALGLTVRRWRRIAGLVARALLEGEESPKRRLKALLHTCLGACYAVQLQKRGVDHIHAHHGYFGSWIAMVAARLLGISFSLTLHGSDLLIDGAYLDTKLRNCSFCVTISEYNRHYILENFAAIDPAKVIVARLGVDVPEREAFPRFAQDPRGAFTLLAVGRLHAVKDHAFLVRACAQLRNRGLDFECVIAGEGPERQSLELLIRDRQLQDRVTLLGHVATLDLDPLYRRADVVALTSRSEGIPLVLMEAMARGRIVLAPAITGIPEIVIPGKTGFLYEPGDLEDFVAKILFLQQLTRGEDQSAVSRSDWIRHAARIQILHNFNRRKNLTHLGDRFLQLTANRDFTNRDFTNQDFTNQDWSPPHENLVLQQI